MFLIVEQDTEGRRGWAMGDWAGWPFDGQIGFGRFQQSAPSKRFWMVGGEGLEPPTFTV